MKSGLTEDQLTETLSSLESVPFLHLSTAVIRKPLGKLPATFPPFTLGSFLTNYKERDQLN